MKRAPKPLAVFAANDQQALDVLESCESVGIAVPEQVAIIGAENYLPAPETMRTPISSVDTNLEMLGYRGAQLLDDLMHGKPAPAQPIRVPAAGIIARKSSDILTIAHRGVARSLRHIWEHSHEPICVKDLVGVAGMSRRGLHMAFWEHLGRTPGQELQRVRIDHAEQMLRGSDHKIETIATLCGYQSANSFCIAFKRVTGMSAKQFREQTPAFGLADATNRRKPMAVS
jgi:LacI family transcriptional regulator